MAVRRLALNDNAEFNSLVRDDFRVTTETEPVVTLDDCLGRYGWKDIVFMKIDAEVGDEYLSREGTILHGMLPLDSLRNKAGADLHLELCSSSPASVRVIPADSGTGPVSFPSISIRSRMDTSESILLQKKTRAELLPRWVCCRCCRRSKHARQRGGSRLLSISRNEYTG